MLLACIGIIVVASVEPIAGQMMGMMGGHTANETADHHDHEDMMHGMMQHMHEHMEEHMGEHTGRHTANVAIVQPVMGNQSTNETMMYCVTDNLSANETIMYCIMGNYSANANITQPIAGNYSANNNTMHDMLMHCVKGESPTSGSCYVVSVDQNITNPTLARLDCARFWLQQAIDLHKVHLKDPSTATNESQMLMMDQMMRAYDCLTGTNMTTGMANTTGVNIS